MTTPRPLELFTVYRNPRDYPGKLVVRRWTVDGGEPKVDPVPVAIVDTLDEARASVPPWTVKLDRSPEDEAQIVETWI